MKKLLLISIFLNLGLVVAVSYGLKNRPSAPVADSASTAASTENEADTTGAKVARAPGKHTVKEAPLDKTSFNWREVESADYKTYIENLRRIHCPEPTIADIIIMDVNKYYRNQLAPLRGNEGNAFHFWENDNGWGRRNPEYQKALVEAEKEKKKLLKELLGNSYREETAKLSNWDMEPKDPFLQGLPKETRDRLAEIRDEFNDRRNEIFRRTRGMQDEEDTAELKKIEKEQNAELAKVLSPEELLEYRMRTAQSIQSMKWNELDGFNATEDEFRAIAKAKLAMEDAGDANARSEYEKSVKAALGEERYKELEANQNWDYRSLKKIIEKNGGDPSTAQQISQMKDDVQKVTRQIRDNRTLSTAERDAKLLAVEEEVKKTLTDAMGEKGYKTFKRYGNAWWIRDISQGIPKPAKTSAPAK